MSLKINKNYKILFIFMISGLICSSCIDEINITGGNGSGLFVVDASLVKNSEIQQVILSRSIGNLNDTVPYEEKCIVFVEDEFGTRKYFTLDTLGTYKAAIEDDYLVIGRNYRITIEIKNGAVYQSDFDVLYDCLPVDSLYYQIEYKYNLQNKEESRGFQFYIDLPVKEEYSRYYRWIMEEDWEIRIPYVFYGIWDKDTLIANIQDLSRCFKHTKSKHLCSSSTENLINNSLKKQVPVFFIGENSGKFRYRYSLLVNQISLSPNAYAYWQNKKVEIQESGGLYTAQPSQNIGNIKNINDEEEKILGYFWVGTKAEKRFFINKPVHHNDPAPDCLPSSIDSTGYEEYVRLMTVYEDTSGFLYDSIPPDYNPDLLFYVTAIDYEPLFFECDDSHEVCKLLHSGFIGYSQDMSVWDDPGSKDISGGSPNLFSTSRGCFDCRGPDSDTAVPEFWR